MPSSTISTHVSPGITLRAPAYYSPLTITATGSVDSGASPSAIYGPTAGASITNYGTVSSAAGNGINLAAGGIVNNVIGNIAGYSGGVLMEGSGGTTGITGTVTNAGTIASTGTGYFTRAIGFYAGGMVTNTGLITSHWSGVTFNFLNTTAGGVGTVNNYGTIAVTTVGTITGGDAVGFEFATGEDGTLINTGLISQTGRGNAVGGNHGTVNNSGTIFETSSYSFAAIHFDEGSAGNGGVVTNSGSIIAQGAASVGIDLHAGSVTNDDLIEGGNEGVLFTGGAGTVVNYGTIIGYGGVALSFTGGGNLLKIESGAVFVGAVNGGAAGAGNTLELTSSGGAGTISGIGSQFLNFKSVYVDAGATWLLSGSNTIGSGVNLTVGTGGTLSLTGSFTNLGTVTPSFIFNAQNVTLSNSGAINGPGYFFTLTSAGYIDNLATGTINKQILALPGAGPSTIVNSGSIAEVTLDSGGKVTNGAGGATGALIQNGIIVNSVATAIVNFGTVGVNGIQLTAAGGSTIINGQSGSGAGLVSVSLESAVRISGGAAAITNYGTVSNTATSPGEGGSYAGILFFQGGSVTNAQAGATIFGYDDGVLATIAPATVTNFGNIHNTGTGTAGAGVALSGGGTVLNEAGGVVSGSGTGSFSAGFGVSVGYGRANSTSFGGIGTVENYGIIGGSGGIYLHAGGTVTNAAGALITGSRNGAVYAGQVATVINAGTISGTGTGFYSNYGIYLFAGGVVTNAAGALISGGETGISFEFPYPGVLSNQGTIVGSNYRGVYLGGGGTITNAAGALISGLGKGVYLEGFHAQATLINSGRIVATAVSGSQASYASGVYVYARGNITNNASGLISGFARGIYLNGTFGHTIANFGTIVGSGTAGIGVDVGRFRPTSTTLTNAGTIIGAGGTAVAFSGGYNRVIDDPGAVFGGVVSGGTAIGNVLELAAGAGSLSGLGSNFINFSGVTVDPGASWQVSGSGAGAAFSNNGTIIVPSGGSLSLGPVTGSGATDVLGNGVAVFAGSVAAGQAIVLGGAGSKLDLTNFSGQYLQGFSATIGGLAVGSGEVELAGVPFSGAVGAVLSGNTITVTNGGATVAALTLATAPNPVAVMPEVQADPSGGTDVFLAARPTTSTVFDFVYTYPDGKDYYAGTVADNGGFGYQTGAVINLPGGGQYQITGQERGTVNTPGDVFVTYYSHDGIGQASPEPQTTAAGQADGTGGLGSETDTLLGTDGQSHVFSPADEASFTVNQQYGFVYNYADGSAYYTGTVSDNGSFGYAAVAASPTPFIFTVGPLTGAVVGHYSVFADGQTSDPSGTVRLTSYVDGRSGSTLSLGDAVSGTSGLGNEAGGFFVGSSFFTFSDTQELIDPPAPVGTTPGGSPTSPNPAPSSDISLVDTSTGKSLSAAAIPYSGPVAGLQYQYIYTGTDNVNVTVMSDNWFLKGGPGEDALQAFGGYNVLDGSTGSNFLTGGNGTDTFFVDDRNPSADVWSTINNFHLGDDATVFGVVNSPTVQWFDNQGAPGFTGLTLHVFGQNTPTASLTLVGHSSSDLGNGRLTVQFGNETDGTPFMHIIGTG
jgi:hypothetical protein